MKYMGSKNRLSKELAPIIQKYIDDNNIENYLEPFVGEANIIDKIKCKNKYGNDNHKYLIALLKQTQLDLDSIPNTITKEQYINIKENKSNYKNWEVGLAGFCASYNAKWFGGYANNVKTKIGTIRNYTDKSIKNLKKQAPKLKDIIFKCCDFRNIKPIKNYVIYCDIPYRCTTKYSTSKDFPYEEFYEWCKKMSKDNIVLISEYNMPKEFECIWEKKIETSMDNNRKLKDNKNKRTEKLFIYKGDS